MRKLWNSVTFHPLLFAVYPALFLYAHNLGQLELLDVVRNAARTLLFAAVGFGLLHLLLRNVHKSAVGVSASLLLYSSLNHLRESTNGAMPPIVVALVGVALVSTLVVWLRRATGAFLWATSVFNVFGLVLVTFPAFTVVRHELSVVRTLKGMTQQAESEGESVGGLADAALEPDRPHRIDPDIYLILLDSYARADVLREVYDYDNSAFLNALRENGFYVADKAIANYCQTGLALSAVLNSRYLDSLVARIGTKTRSHEPLAEMIENGSVIRDLRRRGYQIVAFESGYHETQLETADIVLSAQDSVVSTVIATNPPLRQRHVKAKQAHRRIVLNILDRLGGVAAGYPSPKFVFAHIEAPHPPFVFGPEGQRTETTLFTNHDGDRIIGRGRLSREQYRSYYCDQVTFINRRVAPAIEQILAESPTPPVILLFGDHGPRSELYWRSVVRTNMWECMGILNAYYLPSGTSHLYPSISPVNSFRVVFDRVFGIPQVLLDDRSYFSTDHRLYEFHDVTARALVRPGTEE
jgi:hypothetical protein